MEIYRQPIRIYEGNYVTMLGMVSDLTGLVRGYYKNWKRSLSERKEDLQRAKNLGNTIVGLASQRSWRKNALQDVLRSLYIQDKQMHQLVSNILIDARASQEVAKHRDLHDQLQVAFQEENTKEIWEVSRQLYRLTHQTLDFLESDASHSTAFSRQLEGARKEDPVLYRKIVFSLNEVVRLHVEARRNGIPQPRIPRRAVEIYRGD